MAIFDRFRRGRVEPYDARRQSSARPSAAKTLDAMRGGVLMPGALDGETAIRRSDGGSLPVETPINTEVIREAYQTLQKYKAGKANLEKRIVANERWYKMRHWEMLRNADAAVKPASGWLFTAIANKHADVMDNYPSPNILPREQSDEYEAKVLSSVIPVILDSVNFEQTYDDVSRYKIKNGTGVYGVFWDTAAAHGMGDIAIRKIDLLSLFWEPGITDIQRSRNVFHVELRDNDLLVDEYPQLAGKLGTSTLDMTKYVYDDAVDTSDKSAVVDWYYKKRTKGGASVLHYVKFVNDEVLFATENVPEFRNTGLYDHGLYPFELDVLFAEEGSCAGFGYVDIGKDAQEYIDRGNQAIMENMLANVRPRYFIRSDGAVNEAEYADQTKPFIHVDGALGSDSILPVNGKGLDSIYVEVLNAKIEELKECTSTRDVSTGGAPSGVTAASAIASLIESGSKVSRDSIRSSYRTFRRIVYLMIELIRQFYDLPRKFRIMGMQGAMQFVTFNNDGLLMQTDAAGNVRLPEFDIEVTAQKASPYAKMSNNELALQLYGLGFYNPANALPSLIALDMMDFDKRDELKQKITQTSQIFLANGGMMNAPRATGGAVNPAALERGRNEDVSVGGNTGGEAANTKKARRFVAESTSPR